VAGCVTALKRPTYRALTADAATMTTTVKKLKSKAWASWQIHRFSMPHFLPVYPFLHLVTGKRPVLDFGCGVGHAAFLMSRAVPGACITCADVLFHSLYMARKFFVPEGNFVCADGEYLLPFDSAYFSSVFSSDAIHFIDSKLGLVQEFRRTVSQDGTVILPHLHNGLSPVRSGRSLSPDGYRALFAGRETRLMPEDSARDQFFATGSLNLEENWKPEELRTAFKGLSLVASENSSVFRCYDGLWKKHADRIANPVVNPLYRSTGGDGKWVLTKSRTPSQESEDGNMRAYLPNEVSIDLPSLRTEALRGLKTSDPAKFVDLARQLVFIDTPQRFQ